jgi:hypothetical protein
MQLRWYAETPARRSRQIAADLLGVVAILLCVWLGTAVHDLTAELAGPGRTLEAAGADLADRMSEAGSAAGEVPLVGEQLQDALEQGADAGRSIEAAGLRQQRAVLTLANALGWATGGLPALVVMAFWLPKRLRFARQAGEAFRLRKSGAGLDVFAFRALARQPLSQLLRLPKDPAAGWRDRDPDVIEALAALELRDVGLSGRRRN